MQGPGLSADNIIKQCLRTGEEIPESILNKPELEIGLGLFFNAFFDLDGERLKSDTGINPIPWSVINKYAEYHRLDREQTEDLQFHIRVMDNFVINRARAKQQSQNGKNSK